MVTNFKAALRSFQHADSFFPSGTVAISSGLESLNVEGIVNTSDSIERFLLGQLKWRWATMERSFVVHAAMAKLDFDALSAIDSQIEVLSLAREARDGSVRSGRALLKVHTQLGTVGADRYEARVSQGLAIGHNQVVQGLVWSSVGIHLNQIELMSAHTFCIGILGAGNESCLDSKGDGQGIERIINRSHRS